MQLLTLQNICTTGWVPLMIFINYYLTPVIYFNFLRQYAFISSNFAILISFGYYKQISDMIDM